MSEEQAEELLNYIQPDITKEISLSTLQKSDMLNSPKIWIKNLPKGLSESGITNLFLSIGKPTSINVIPRINSACVEFNSLSEAQLAIRDLHNKPPYKLKIAWYIPKKKEEKADEASNLVEKFETFSVKETPIQNNVTNDNTEKECTNEIKSWIQNVIDILGYDPSVRMRQRNLDFKTEVECVSLGRGYLNMGNVDRFVGGLQKFLINSENCKSKDKMSNFCENCNAFSTKICTNCSAPYCSELCLSKSSIDHTEGCALKRSSRKSKGFFFKRYSLTNESIKLNSVYQGTPKKFCHFRDLLNVPLLSNCTVVISTYLSMEKVFIRRIDDSWDEEFFQLCNEIAIATLEDKVCKKPEVGDLVIAKYEKDLCFYRARICALSGLKASVFFVDFGNTQETNLGDLKLLPEHLKRIPAFAVKVSLSGVSNSSIHSVYYYNSLTAQRIPLIVKFNEDAKGVTLIEKDSGEVVNEKAAFYALPSWKQESSVLSKSGEVFYLDSLKSQNLEIGASYSLILTHFKESEFMEWEGFWATFSDTDEFFHVNSEMYLNIQEYCQFLKDDCYLPRLNELCLAKKNGQWHRCVNLQTKDKCCCLFFVDDGDSSDVERRNIRRMISDFLEVPAQSVCCTLPEYSKLKTDKEVKIKVMNFLKSLVNQTVNDVKVLKLMGDAYCLDIPRLSDLLT